MTFTKYVVIAVGAELHFGIHGLFWLKRLWYSQKDLQTLKRFIASAATHKTFYGEFSST